MQFKIFLIYLWLLRRGVCSPEWQTCSPHGTALYQGTGLQCSPWLEWLLNQLWFYFHSCVCTWKCRQEQICSFSDFLLPALAKMSVYLRSRMICFRGLILKNRKILYLFQLPFLQSMCCLSAARDLPSRISEKSFEANASGLVLPNQAA